jgi:sodium-coupled neutral amino acid transporter 11
MLRDLSSLRYATLFNVTAIMYIVLAIAINASNIGGVNMWKNWDGVTWIRVNWIELPQVITICFFAFTCHINVFAIYNNLQYPMRRRMQAAVFRAGLLETVIYLLIAISGYISFKDAVDGNVLDNYGHNDKLIIAARVALTLALTVSTVVTMNPCRASLMSLIFPDASFSVARHVIATILLIGGALGLAIEIPGVSIVFGFLGASCCVFFGFYLPIVMYVRVFNSTLSKITKVSLYLLLGILLGIGAASIVLTAYQPLS